MNYTDNKGLSENNSTQTSNDLSTIVHNFTNEHLLSVRIEIIGRMLRNQCDVEGITLYDLTEAICETTEILELLAKIYERKEAIHE